jgi:hypothetical protein
VKENITAFEDGVMAKYQWLSDSIVCVASAGHRWRQRKAKNKSAMA